MGKKYASDKAIMIWCPNDLHAAVRLRLIRDRKTLRGVLIHFLEIYSGYKCQFNEVTNAQTAAEAETGRIPHPIT